MRMRSSCQISVPSSFIRRIREGLRVWTTHCLMTQVCQDISKNIFQGHVIITVSRQTTSTPEYDISSDSIEDIKDENVNGLDTVNEKLCERENQSKNNNVISRSINVDKSDEGSEPEVRQEKMMSLRISKPDNILLEPDQDSLCLQQSGGLCTKFAREIFKPEPKAQQNSPGQQLRIGSLQFN